MQQKYSKTANRKETPNPSHDQWTWWLGIAAVVMVVIWLASLVDERVAAGLAVVRENGFLIVVALAVLSGLVYWGMNAKSVDEAKLALGLFQAVLGFIVLFAAVGFLAKGLKTETEQNVKSIMSTKDR